MQHNQNSGLPKKLSLNCNKARSPRLLSAHAARRQLRATRCGQKLPQADCRAGSGQLFYQVIPHRVATCTCFHSARVHVCACCGQVCRRHASIQEKMHAAMDRVCTHCRHARQRRMAAWQEHLILRSAGAGHVRYARLHSHANAGVSNSRPRTLTFVKQRLWRSYGQA